MTDVWVRDGYGSVALVPADAVDHWKPRGWIETTDPDSADQIWMRHAEHGGRAQFPIVIARVWADLGWAPSAPPEPVDVTKDPALVDQPALRGFTAPQGEEQFVPKKSAPKAATDKHEQEK